MTLSATEIAHAIRTRTRSAAETVEMTIAAVKSRNGAYNAVTRLLEDRARRSAAEIDARIAAGHPVGPLAGVPFGAKDLFDIAGEVTTAGSKRLVGGQPASVDATVVARLCAAGAIPLATMNMDEFAYGFATENAHYGTTRNPHDTARLAGGSSGGSASAVAAGLLPIAIGSDTNGSVRVPASLCGVWGVRPTLGRLPLEGVYPFAASLDTPGPFASTLGDLQLAFEAMDAAPLGTLPDVRSLRVAQLDGWFTRDLIPELANGINALKQCLNTTRMVELPETARARAASFIITAAEGGNLHLPHLKTQALDYDPATRDRLIAGAILPASPILQAHRFRRWFREQIHALFAEVDVLIAPSTPSEAPLIDQPTIMIDGKPVSARANLGIFAQPISLAGMPVVAAPLAKPFAGPAGMPLGVQLIAAPGKEASLFAVGAVLEKAGLLGFPTAMTKG